jgi:uncharacterized membrane protein
MMSSTESKIENDRQETSFTFVFMHIWIVYLIGKKKNLHRNILLIYLSFLFFLKSIVTESTRKIRLYCIIFIFSTVRKYKQCETSNTLQHPP